MFSGRNFSRITRPHTSYLSLRLAVILLITAIIIGIAGFMYIEDYTVVESIYMTVITISTVGFKEIRPLSETGQIFTSALIFLNVLILSYTLSAFTYYVIEGKIFQQLYQRKMNKKVKDMENHVIVCGYGRYGKEIISHLYKQKIEAVIIEQDDEIIKDIQADERNLVYIHNDATLDETLEFAGILKANAIIAALPDDSANVFIVLTARQLNKDVTIISRSNEVQSEKKLQIAGADHVIIPEQIGSFYMATLVSKPSATEFFAFISDELEHDVGYAEISYDSVPEKFKNQPIRELHIRKKTGANIIGYKTAKGQYQVNPTLDTELKPDTSFIIIGNTEQLDRLQDMMNADIDV